MMRTALETYDEAMRRHRREEQSKAVKEAALSAGLTGGVAGAAHSLINGNRSIPSILLRGLGSAAVAAPAAAGATAIGNTVMGAPDEDDPAAYTRRGGVGGGIGGAALGGGIGYLLGSGRLKGLASLPGAAGIGKAFRSALPVDNLLTDQLKKWARVGTHNAGLKSAALLGLGLGGAAALHGSGEGMAIDSLRNLQREPDDDQMIMMRRRYAL